jgi:hypothetical protein
MDPTSDHIRAGGPAAVTEGTPDGPVVLVLDPAGEAKHEGLPATWRGEARTWQVLWCRMPAEGGLGEADDVMADPPGNGVVHVVSGGAAAGLALRLAEEHGGTVRSLLLVDPADDESGGTGERHDKLRDAGVEVEVFTHSPGETEVVPLPLGHPDVVDAAEKLIEQAT